jgi:hypothetical protein
MKKTIVILTAALGLTISAYAQFNQTETDDHGRDAFRYTAISIDNQNGYYTHQLTVISLVARLHFSNLSCDQTDVGSGATYGYGNAWTYSCTTTNPRCQWHWTFDDIPAKYNASNVTALAKTGARLFDASLGKRPGIIVKSDPNGISIKWLKTKDLPFTELVTYSYENFADNLNRGDIEL